MAVIEFLDFGFSYPAQGNQPPFPALHEVNLEVADGAFTVLAGMTGSGKSTLLTCVKPELAPLGEYRGQLRVFGEPLDRSGRQDRGLSSQIGFVLQDPAAQIVTETVWHELAFGLENLGTPPQIMHRRIAETASFFGITNWFEMKTSALSGGQKQLLNLAAIMVMQPRLLLLDEPTSQLDPLATKEFMNALYRVNQELGVTILLITHDWEDVAPLCDQVVFIAHRTVAFSGNFQSFVDKCIADYPDYLPALPSATQLAHLVEPSFRPLPLTVRDGREWLLQRLGHHHPPTDAPLDASAENSAPANATATENIAPAPAAAATETPETSWSQRSQHSQDEVVLAARHVWFSYERNADPVLKELSLELYRGHIQGIVGTNGSGKSTLLALLAGIRKPQRGSLRRSPGLVSAALPQDAKALFIQDSVREELLDNGRGSEYPAAEVDYWLQRLGLVDLQGRHPYDLSGGEQQKLALAKLLLVQPELLLLDEPTKGLDAFTKAELLQILQSLAADGRTIVIVSHDLDFVATAADECSMLFNGSLVGNGSVHQFFAGNLFFTTVIYRITRGTLPNCIRLGDVYPYVR
ncbi:MAG: ATP-binding cassette domain-containing protein [Actinomycetia bacterium]|nr:ATP-binding cassette domain-containing protein [Actinomycetes bacterium]